MDGDEEETVEIAVDEFDVLMDALNALRELSANPIDGDNNENAEKVLARADALQKKGKLRDWRPANW